MLPSDVAKTTFEDLEKLVEQDYEKNDRRASDLKVVLKRLSSTFSGMKATEITPARISTYQAEQKKDGCANATINRDLAALKRAFRLGLRQEFVVSSVPHMQMLKEDNIRKGFFEPDDFTKLLKHLPDELQSLFRVAYITGWRVESELLTRQRQHVDFVHKKLRLDSGEAKSDEPREFPFTDDLKTILDTQRRRADELQKSKNTTVHHVFFRPDGIAILSQEKWWRKAWRDAVTSSGVQRIPHDFRRTAVRNLEMAGVPRTVAMKMVGHKTESMYRRYGIVDEGMQQQAAKKLNALHKMQWAKRKPKTGTPSKRASTR